jgi:glycosyltransferase involved in cell wall biosynthesis
MLAGVLAGVPSRCHTFTGQVWANKTGFERRLLKGIDWLIGNLATCVFADSATQCLLLEREGIVKSGQIRMLGAGSIAGVDLTRFYPDPVQYKQQRERLGTQENACVFLFVGRLARDKGVIDLLTAFQNLAEKTQHIELWVIGPDEEGLLQHLQSMAMRCNAPVRFVGPLLKPEQFMVASDVLLLPSYREGFPSTILEGAACGLPTISYRIYGVIDAIVEGDTGLLVDLGETAALAYAMRSLVLNVELRLSLGSKARERAVRDFSSENVSNAWVEFYIKNVLPRQ